MRDNLQGVYNRLSRYLAYSENPYRPILHSAQIDPEIDAAFVIRPPIHIPKSLDEITLETQPFVLIVQAGDTRSAPDILSQESALIYDRTSWGGRLIEPWIQRHIAQDRILCELDALEAIAAAVGQGLGFAIVPHWPGLEAMPGLCILALPDLPHSRDLVLLHRRLSPEIVGLLCN